MRFWLLESLFRIVITLRIFLKVWVLNIIHLLLQFKTKQIVLSQLMFAASFWHMRHILINRLLWINSIVFRKTWLISGFKILNKDPTKIQVLLNLFLFHILHHLCLVQLIQLGFPLFFHLVLVPWVTNLNKTATKNGLPNPVLNAKFVLNLVTLPLFAIIVITPCTNPFLTTNLNLKHCYQTFNHHPVLLPPLSLTQMKPSLLILAQPII